MSAWRGADTSPNRPRSAANAALLIVSLALSLLALELLLGKFVPELRPYSTAFKGPPMPFIASSYLPATTPRSFTFHHVSPGFDVEYTFNEYGYRGSYPRQLAKPRGSRRLLIVGDSFTLGWGNALQDTFVQLVSDEIGPAGTEVINAGYRGFLSPDTYCAYLRREGLVLEPDLVLVMLFSDNDIEELRDNTWLSLDGRGMPTELGTNRLYTDVNGDFLFPPGSRDRLIPWNYRIPVVRESRTFVGLGQLVNRALLKQPFYQKRHTLLGKLQDMQPVEEGWRRFELSIECLVRLEAERSTRVVFALIPPSPHHWKQDSTQRLNRIRSIVRRSGASLLDLQPSLNSNDYFPEGHFNPNGNETVAHKLIEFLRGSPPLVSEPAPLRQGAAPRAGKHSTVGSGTAETGAPSMWVGRRN
jgi:hypothetical protein